MKKSLVAAAIAGVAVFAGVFYFAREPAQKTAAREEPAKAAKPASAPAETPPPATAPQPGLVSSSAPPPRTAPADPRLAALMVSPDNALIEYFSDSEGRVIKEIDNDPTSPGYQRPLREYTYAGKQVIRLVTHRYIGDQVQVVTADVIYKADGSVDQFHESTKYENSR